MLVISRGRGADSESEADTAALAAKFHTHVWSIPFLYDLPADSLVIDKLRSLSMPACFLTPLSVRAAKSLLNFLQIPHVEIFEDAESIRLPADGVIGGKVEYFSEAPAPRWYPVIDDSQCAGCLECVNYCLFGVYTVGKNSRPLVAMPDACRDGCPACARVCPNNAILFPLCDDRVIAGYVPAENDNLDDLVNLVDQMDM